MIGRRTTRKLAALARGLGWGRNALRRRTDRIEDATVLAAVVLALAAVPVAMSIGTAVYHHGLTLSAEQTASGRQTTAVLLEPAPVLVGPGTAVATVPVRASWTSPSGARHVGQVHATTGAPSGSVVWIWTDRAGQQIDPPLSPGQAWARGGLTTLLGMTAVLALLAGAVAVVRWRLHRGRHAALDAEWRQVGPRWTQRA